MDRIYKRTDNNNFFLYNSVNTLFMYRKTLITPSILPSIVNMYFNTFKTLRTGDDFVKMSFDKSIRKIELIFHYSGVNIRSNQIRRNNRFKSTLVYILNFVWLNTDVLGAIVWFITGLIDGKNFTEVTYVAPCVTLSFLSDFKSLLLVNHEDNVYKLMDKLRCMEMRENGRRKDARKDLIAKNEINFLTAVINVLAVGNGVLIVTFALSPLTLMALKYAKTEELECLLPFLIVYPFDPYDIKIWPIVYLKQLWSVILVVIYICSADFLFYTFCTYLSVQFRLLQYDIELIVPTRNNINDALTYDDKFQEKLINLIKWHQDLIESVNLLETIYAKSTLYNFISSSIVICLTGFNVTAISDVALVIPFLSFLFMSLSQIFFLCFFGDKMIEASTKVGDAVYNSKWYLSDPGSRKNFLVIQIRGQSPCKLTAFGFAEVNLRAFMKILSTSWSYFALLQTLYTAPTTQS